MTVTFDDLKRSLFGSGSTIIVASPWAPFHGEVDRIRCTEDGRPAVVLVLPRMVWLNGKRIASAIDIPPIGADEAWLATRWPE